MLLTVDVSNPVFLSVSPDQDGGACPSGPTIMQSNACVKENKQDGYFYKNWYKLDFGIKIRRCSSGG